MQQPVQLSLAFIPEYPFACRFAVIGVIALIGEKNMELYG